MPISLQGSTSPPQMLKSMSHAKVRWLSCDQWVTDRNVPRNHAAALQYVKNPVVPNPSVATHSLSLPPVYPRPMLDLSTLAGLRRWQYPEKITGRMPANGRSGFPGG